MSPPVANANRTNVFIAVPVPKTVLVAVEKKSKKNLEENRGNLKFSI